MVKLLTFVHHLLDQERHPDLFKKNKTTDDTPNVTSVIIPNLSLSCVQVNHLNAVVVSIHPVQNALGNVQTQPIRPKHRLTGQEYLVVGTVHPGFLDLASIALGGVLLPVRPVHPAGGQEEGSEAEREGRRRVDSESVSPMLGVHHNGSRVAHLALNESFAGLRSLLQPGDTDSLLRPVVSPVEITPHPVDSNPLNSVNT